MSGVPEQKKQLGKILLKQKLVTPDELKDYLAAQKSGGGRLASKVRGSGKVPDVDLLKALSEQHGVPGIDLTQVVVPLSNLSLIPAAIARQHLILPLVVKEDRVFLAMADPRDKRVIDEIEFVTGRRVFPYVALHESLEEVIGEAYRSLEQGEQYYIGPRAPAEYLQELGQPGSDASSSGRQQDPTPAVNQAVVVDKDLSDDLGLSELTLKHKKVPPDGREGSEHPKRPSRRPPGTPACILVVDDEDDIRRLLRRVLAERGFEVVEAAKGLEALQAVRDNMPDLILLDAMLPEVHGFDICRRIKRSKRYGHIPVIMVSAIYRGWRFAEDLKQSYGAEAFLEKPFKIGDVVALVQEALEGRKMDEEAESEDDMLSREASEALAQGMDAYHKGDLETAVTELKRGVGIDPLSFQLHFHLGLLYGRRDEVFEAIDELEAAVDLQPRHFGALKNLAILYQRAGFKHKAVEMWERALGSCPDDKTRDDIKQHLVSLL